jgi:hypothetical protein
MGYLNIRRELLSNNEPNDVNSGCEHPTHTTLEVQ